MRVLLLLLGVVAVLAGCQTKQIQEMSYSEKKALAQQIVQRCVDQGVKTGTQEMRICTAAEIQKEHYGRQANAIRMQRAMAGIGQGFQNASQGYYRAAAMNRPVNCTSTPTPSGTIRTSCF